MNATGRRKLKIILASVAVLGLGAAITSAVWTDDVFFKGDVSVGQFNIQGSTDGSTWQESDTWDGTESGLSTVTLAFADLGPLVPGQDGTWTGTVRNDPTSSVNGDLSAISLDTSLLPAALASSLTTTVAYDTPAAATDVAPGAELPFTVTVTLADDAPATLMGATGSLVVQVTGTAIETP